MGHTNKTAKFQLPQFIKTDKPQMADFNDAFKNIDDKAVSKAGDTMTGDLYVNKLYPSILLGDSGGKGAQTFIQNANHITWITTRNDIGVGDNYRGIIVGDAESYSNLKSAVKVVEKINGGAVQYYNIYGEHNKPTADDVGARSNTWMPTPADVGAVSKTGDTISGKVTIENTGFQTQLKIKRTGSTLGVAIPFENDNGLLGAIGMTAKGAVTFVGSSDTSKLLFSEVNKPTGTYTGNGSAESRTVQTNGVGKFVYIQSSQGVAILTGTTGVCWDTSGVRSIPYAEGHFADGIITIASDDPVLNMNGVAYGYQTP